MVRVHHGSPLASINKMTLYNIFPLSIYHSKITIPVDEKKRIIETITRNKFDQKSKRYKENTFAWTGDQEGYGSIHNVEVFNNLFKEIKLKIIDYLSLLSIDHTKFDIYFQRSWATISNNKEFIGRHNHAQSHISFAYYLKKVDDDSGIIFWDTNKANEIIPELFESPTVKIKNIIKEKNPNNSVQAKMNVKEDDILIFPSKIFHSTEKNKNNNNRISISADISLYAKDEKFLEHLTPPLSNWKKF